MQIHRNKAAAIIQSHSFAPRLVAVAGNDYPAIAFDIPSVHVATQVWGVETATIRPDEHGLYSLERVRDALGY